MTQVKAASDLPRNALGMVAAVLLIGNLIVNKISGAFRHAASAVFMALAAATSAQAESRGYLLHTMHCMACHTTQMHWRDQRVVTNWPRLKAEVRQWQGTAALDWSEADIVAVARYLNESSYHFPAADSLAQLRQPLERQRSLVVKQRDLALL